MGIVAFWFCPFGDAQIKTRIVYKDITIYKPDALIFIDYPGFNLRIAKWAKSENFSIITKLIALAR